MKFSRSEQDDIIYSCGCGLKISNEEATRMSKQQIDRRFISGGMKNEIQRPYRK